LRHPLVVLVFLMAVLAVAGIPLLVFSFLVLRRLNAAADSSGGSVWGRRLAVGGMLLGLTGTLLGVIGVVAIILVRVGEDSRRLACADNLRRIGLAVVLYNDINDHFPAATVDPHNSLAGFALWRNPPYVKRLSWMVELLPYLEQSPETAPGKGRKRAAPTGGKYQALYDRFDLRQPWDAEANREPAGTRLELFVCPSHPRSDRNLKPAPTDYPGIAGIGADAAFLPKDSPRAGFFGYERVLHVERVGETNDLPAGTSHTMLGVETARDNGPWAAGGRSTVRPLTPSDLPYVGVGGQFGGLHPGGANLLKVDASVEFFSDSGDAEPFERLAVLGGGDW
jgi:hypothetical protein